MNLPPAPDEERTGLFIRFAMNKIETVIELLKEKKNTLLITGSSYYSRYFLYHLRNNYNSLLYNEIELNKSGDFSAKSLIKLQKPYILISDYFPDVIGNGIEEIVYFNIPLRISGFRSDIHKIRRGRGLKIVLLVDPEDYSAMPEDRDDDDAAGMYEWISRGGCLSAGDTQGSVSLERARTATAREECGNRTGRKGFDPGGMEIKLVSLIACRKKGMTISRAIELGQGLKSGDLFFSGYGVLRGIPRDKIAGEIFRLKNEGIFEFKNWGSEIVVKLTDAIAQGMK